MSVIAPETRAERWLYLNLTGDATIAGIVGTRVYAGRAPKSVTTYPMIVFSPLSSGIEVYGNEAYVIWTKLTYLVKAITQGNSVTALQTLVDQIHTVLHAQHGATSDARIDYCKRVRPFRMTTEEGDALYQHLGGEYELAVAKA